RYFAYMNLFMFSMLTLVLANNFVLLFVGWEGVGLCSYLLIGYYYEREYAAAAGRKAFVVNRIGDFGFLLGMFGVFSLFGTLDFGDVFSRAAANPGRFAPGLTVVCLLLFLGAMGKSAQVPLHVWLPDAMAGPTPVHALGGEQDMRRMGGLAPKLPVTYRTFLVATLALAGIPPLAGFFSKDAILTGVFAANRPILFAVGLFTAGLTAFYMFRLVSLTFSGRFRGSAEVGAHVHEA